jgi:hypothetical protein
MCQRVCVSSECANVTAFLSDSENATAFLSECVNEFVFLSECANEFAFLSECVAASVCPSECVDPSVFLSDCASEMGWCLRTGSIPVYPLWFKFMCAFMHLSVFVRFTAFIAYAITHECCGGANVISRLCE